jgi:hypothetical protein
MLGPWAWVSSIRFSCSGEVRQHDRWLRREKENSAILDMAMGGATIKEIVRRTGVSRGLVRQIVPRQP